ncbi:MAG: hypothetical protein ACI9P7_002540 [Candidatus Azotimanducaceae bacterium]|jgi:hypothetical protein
MDCAFGRVERGCAKPNRIVLICADAIYFPCRRVNEGVNQKCGLRLEYR